MTEQHRLAAAIPPLLEQLHASAAALRRSLEVLQESPKAWQPYLLQPHFAIDTAERLDGSFEQPYALAAALMARLDYGDSPMDTGSDARATLQIPGLLSVPAEAINLAHRLNRDKEAFAEAVAAFKAHCPGALPRNAINACGISWRKPVTRGHTCASVIARCCCARKGPMPSPCPGSRHASRFAR
ncbi:hypothetical protein [Microbulbifer halophilus]|uniref:hypothetical protein n=1 Tax=Microbulbifer halophilus TaxID=453963 RepID=UPI0036157F82